MLDVPDGVVTRTSTVPAGSMGVTATMALSDSTVKLCAATPPKVTLVAALKPEPRMTTLSPPAVLPEVLLRPLMLGAAAALNVN
jgi:hypothetical protein